MSIASRDSRRRRSVSTCARPYLSAYMGHTQLSDTFHYIHLIPDTLQPMGADMFAALIPEVDISE